VGSTYGSRQILHAKAEADGSSFESDDRCFVRGFEASSISTAAPDSPIELTDLDADRMSTSVNCARPKTSSTPEIY